MKFFYKIVSVIFFLSMIYCSEPFSEQKKGKNYNIKRNSSTINLDGLMIENVWGEVDIINDYVQYSPFNMSNPTFKTETRMFYNDEGIYIFSRMYDDNPDQIQQRLANRDDYQNGFIESSDWVYFAFDSRHDHQTGYVFAINCSGVKVDAAIYDDEGFDLDYNSLWYGETNIDEFGWTAEIMIPFSALRFDSKVNETWGFNTKRYI